jgi:hypothetical protein
VANINDYLSDPEPPDENDPAFQQEVFEMCRARGWRPEDLRDKAFARTYAEWLKTAEPDE